MLDLARGDDCTTGRVRFYGNVSLETALSMDVGHLTTASHLITRRRSSEMFDRTLR
jgi:hypothetical protein